MRIIHDQMAGWLEDALRPELDKLHREFLWQYLLIYDQWARFHAQSAGIEDQQSLAQLAVFAEAALRDIASQFPVRLWLNAIRSIPLPVFAYIALPPSTPQLMELVKIATSAACRYGDRNPLVFEDDDENSMVVELEWLEEFKRKLPVNVPRFIGAAHTWYYARGWYRIAGKGGVLRPPQLADLKVARDVLDRLEPGKIMLVPSATFENDDEIMPQVLEYDRRTAEAGGASVTGVLPGEQPSGSKTPDPLSWWKLGISANPAKQQPIEIYYPLQNTTLITTSYWLNPEELTPHLEELAPFAGMMPERLGMTLESFGLCCRAVAAAVRHETGYMNLREAPDRAGAIRLRSEGQKLENEKKASSFLFSVMHRGLLRAPRRSWMTIADQACHGRRRRPSGAGGQHLPTPVYANQRFRSRSGAGPFSGA